VGEVGKVKKRKDINKGKARKEVNKIRILKNYRLEILQ